MDIATLLNSEFKKRKQKNARYSLRAFAKSLNLDATALLRIMQEERVPTVATSLKILKALGLEQPTAADDIRQRIVAKKKQKHLLHDSFDPKEFETMFESNHLYVLSALRSTQFTLSQIKAKLWKSCGVSESDFNKIIRELQSIGAVNATGNSFETVIKHKSTVPIPFTTEKRRKMQQEFLAKAIQAVEEISFEERENATLTLSLSKKDWPQVKRILKEARAKINRLSEKAQPTDTVYNICMASYPVIKF